ncbi:MAG: hypothetical protein ACRD2U_07265 [Terriglobales bacterium]
MPTRELQESQPEIDSFPETPVDIDKIRERITNIVGNQAIGMVKNTVSQVKNGQYLAMKYLFEMIGLFPAAASEHAGEDSLAKILLEKFDIREEGSTDGASLQTEVTKDSSSPVKKPAVMP